MKTIIRSLHSKYPAESRGRLVLDRNKNELVQQLASFFNLLRQDNNAVRPSLEDYNDDNNLEHNELIFGSAKKRKGNSPSKVSKKNVVDRPHISFSGPASMNTQRKMAFYNLLVSQYGIPQNEVVQAIESMGDGPDIDVEILLGVIMSVRELINDERDKELMLEEENMMTQAILNSESERDVIERRKKDRLTSLREDIAISLDDATEFFNSVLLGKYYSNANSNSNNHSSSSSSSSCSSGSSSSSSSNISSSSNNSASSGYSNLKIESKKIKEIVATIQKNKDVTNIDCRRLRFIFIYFYHKYHAILLIIYY